MSRTLLFEHIPKTGGITLRSILLKVYGQEQVFVINSNNPGSSLDAFKKMDSRGREKIKVVAGHGALLFEPYLKNPFKITILRDPLQLFLSQFYYLKISKKDAFWEDVKEMNSPGEYLNYALSMGQDNLMTRFLANSMDWTVDPDKSFHSMDQDGERLFQKAKINLEQINAAIHLDNFDAGVFKLSKVLEWPNIPIYRSRNRTPIKPTIDFSNSQSINHLQQALRYDIELFDFFKAQNLDFSKAVVQNSVAFRIFKTRQLMIKKAAQLLRKG